MHRSDPFLDVCFSVLPTISRTSRNYPDVKLEQKPNESSQKLKPVIVPDVKHETDVPPSNVQSVVGPRIRIRYPGDLFDIDVMDRMQLKRCVQMCKENVDSNNKSSTKTNTCKRQPN